MSEDTAHQVTAWLAAFEAALTRRDSTAAAALFTEEGFWRDFIAFTWNIVTIEGRDGIRTMLDDTLARVAPHSFTMDGVATETDGVILSAFTFETGIARGKGILRLRSGRCWVLLTTMQELIGFEEPLGHRRDEGIHLGAQKGRGSWLEDKTRADQELGASRQPYCLIVGASQNGLALAARLKHLNVPTLVIDSLERPGDAWRARYKSLCLHDPVWQDHMPYLPFPSGWPVYTPKDRMADWLEMYAKVLALTVWGSTTCQSARYDAQRREWVVTVERDGQPVTLRPAHLILATGLSGKPQIPVFPGAETFTGAQYHSSQYRSGESAAGKRCVVIGSNNSAHDICVDLWEHDADVTMIQRSPTLVARLASLRKLGDGGPFSEAAAQAGMTTDHADLLAASMPFRLLRDVSVGNYRRIREQDAAFYERLRAAGFQLTFGEDESGIALMYMRRAAGYYIDVGASDLIASGAIRLKSGTDVVSIKPNAVVLRDGSELPADVIVFATGFESMESWAAQLISPAVAQTIGKCWGLGSGMRDDPGPWEGELRNMWKPTAQEGLWFQAGNLAQARHFSCYLALQLKARMEGIPTPVYRPAG